MPSFKMLALSTAAAALIAGTGIAAAQTPSPSGGPDRAAARASRFIEFLDTNKDGKISLQEITDEEGRLFSATDVNNDAGLSPEEFQRRGEMFMRLRVMTLFDLLDANGDSKLTKDELAAPASRWFKRYDKNGDGFLAADEVPQPGMAGRPGMGPGMGPRR